MLDIHDMKDSTMMNNMHDSIMIWIIILYQCGNLPHSPEKCHTCHNDLKSTNLQEDHTNMRTIFLKNQS